MPDFGRLAELEQSFLLLCEAGEAWRSARMANTWHPRTGTVISESGMSKMDPFGENLRLALSPGGKRLASPGSDSTFRLWNLEDASVTSVSIPNNGGFARSLAFSNDGQFAGGISLMKNY